MTGSRHASSQMKSTGRQERPVPENAEKPLSYFKEVLMVVKFVLSWLPTPFTAAMIAIAMPAAIKPYSIAVAPDSSFKNLTTKAFIVDLPYF